MRHRREEAFLARTLASRSVVVAPPAREPRTVLWDIETTHNLAAVFRLFGEDYISHENLIQERYMVCAAWKNLGDAAVKSVSTLDDPRLFKRDPTSDLHVCRTLHAVLSAADVIVAHNGDAYDIKFAEARMHFHGLPPLPPIQSIDTLKIAKQRFMFNSNKLDYLGRFFKVGTKTPTTPGLWLRVLQHRPAAIREMLAYNKQDVLLLEKVFLKLRPYATGLNRHLFGQTGCPRCGSHDTQRRGVHRAISRVYQRLQCQGCGGWFRQDLPLQSIRTRLL